MSVSELWVYPVKSAAGVRVDRAEVAARGFAGDRRWMIIDEDGEFISQRSNPRLALVEVVLAADRLILNAPGCAELVVSREVAGAERIEAEVWGDRCAAYRTGDAADGWFAELLGRRCSLVYMPESTQRRVDPDFAGDDDIVSFADGYPFLLIGQSSLDDLNRRLDEPVPMNRFRPNIVVDGAEAFAEDDWARIRIGGVAFEVVKPCSRCAITTVDQATGRRGKEPLRTLATYRRVGNKVMFGQNLLHRGRGTICVGDAVESLAPGAPGAEDADGLEE